MQAQLRVFKFGGAALQDAAGIRNVANILGRYQGQSLLVVVSAMGKTTNALEQVVAAHAAQDGRAPALLAALLEQHFAICQELFPADHEIFALINDIFVEVDWVLDDQPHPHYDYMYDQIVPVGELASSRMVSAFLAQSGVPTQWLDSRDVIRTNELYRESWVLWPETEERAQRILPPLFAQPGLVVAPGFIGSTAENFTTTLGRDGSDFSAAIFAYCLNARDLTIWKDAPGVLSADPRYFKDPVLLPELSFREAIEMTYYGAKVIHLKATGPLERKQIPLYVKSFLDPQAPGTYIAHDVVASYPPMALQERSQALLSIATRDFSFVSEPHLSTIFQQVAALRLQVNLFQITAMTFYLVVNDQENRVDRLREALEAEFVVTLQRGLELLTLRYADEAFAAATIATRPVLLDQQHGVTRQLVLGA